MHASSGIQLARYRSCTLHKSVVACSKYPQCVEVGRRQASAYTRLTRTALHNVESNELRIIIMKMTIQGLFLPPQWLFLPI
eukprot:4399208-Amphidinium_carterae.1